MANINDPYRPITDEELIQRFKQNFSTVASFQGRLSYLIMSVHVMNPEFLQTHVSYSASTLLYFNMVYGVGVMIYSRPNMKPIGPFNRAVFSILGSLMFNYSSVAVFKWIRDNTISSIPGLAACLGFLASRIFMLHLLAFLYHVDIRGGQNIPRNSAFDSMYYQAICLGLR